MRFESEHVPHGLTYGEGSHGSSPRAQDFRLRQLTILLPLLVLATASVLTWLAWRYTIHSERRASERALSARATSIEITLRDRLLAYEAVLRAGVGLFEASDEVNEEEWRAFTRQLELATFYPGLQGLGYATRLSRDANGRDRTAIIFLEPANERNKRAIGFDMMSENVRRVAMERARDEGHAALTGRVTLVQEITPDKQAGFLIYVPVYRGSEPPATLEERRRSLLGFVYCPFRAEDFLNMVLVELIKDVQVKVHDFPRNGVPHLMYSSAASGATSSFVSHQSRVIELLGHRWLIEVDALENFANTNGTAYSRWVVMTGASTALLLSGLVWALALSRQRLAERLAIESAARQRERYSAEVLANSLDAYIAIDAEDRIVEWNRQAEIVFGWTSDQAQGLRLVDTIVPERYRDQHLVAVQSFATRTHTLLGRRIEMPARRRDGQEITIELSILPTTRSGQPLFVASLRDITELRRHETEIAKLTATLEQRVARRTEELAEANRELQAANQQLEAFAQNVSHDLRAPLRAVQGYTQIAIEESGDRLPESARTHLNVAIQQANKMQRLIGDLLKLALIGRQHVQRRVVNVGALIWGLLDDFKPSGLPAIEMRPEELGNVLADPALLEHAFRNLIANAIKFSRHARAPRIQIGSTMVNGERVYYVKDNGVGFDSRHASNLFKAFHRLHGSEEFEGTGIGLTIVKSVVEKHGGRIWAESEPGTGATFFFTLQGKEQSRATA